MRRPLPVLCRRFPRCIGVQSAPRRYSSTAANGAPAYEEYDIAIVGGGPVGLALAGALSSSNIVRANLRIALIETGDLDQIRNWSLVPDKYSNRVSSLTNVVYAFLQDIGAWDYVQNERTCPIENMEVWDGTSGARISFNVAETTRSQFEGMARLTENLNLQRGLLRLLDNVPAVDLIHQTRVTSIDSESQGFGTWPIVNLNNGRRLRARLLVGADGSNSPVRNYAQISSFGWPYNARGLVATLVHRPRGAFEGPNTTAYQRFLPTGPIAFLPLSPTISSLVWSTKPHIADALQVVDPSVLACMINAAFRLPQLSLEYLYNQISEAQIQGTALTGEQIQEEIIWREKSHCIDQHSALSSSSTFSLAGMPPTDSELFPPLVTSVQPGTVASFPLLFRHTESYLGEGAGARTVLIGDAAHTIHPLAGQGLNLGLGDVESLSRCIKTAVLSGGDIGSYTVLQSYSRERYLTNHIIMAAVDKLHKILGSDKILGPESVLEAINESESLKAVIVAAAGGGRVDRAAMGWGGMTKGVEAFGDAVRAAQALGQNIRGIVSNGVQSLIMERMARRH
ncbi:putative ubiquinone biosynthesis monooxygenase [Leucoagaricus gongylophorus]